MTKIIKKLFGETDIEQFDYLKPRVTALGIGIALLLLGFLFTKIGLEFCAAIAGVGEIIIVVVCFILGWSIIRGLFGIVSVGTIFSGNIVFGSAIFILYVIISFLGGLVVSFIAVCRFFVLLKNFR